MKFYQTQHEFYCGIDLHASTLHACVIDAAGKKHLHRNFKCSQPDRFLAAVAPYRRSDLVVACESTFNWYWLADLCSEHEMLFILGHALYMKAIHGGKTKSDPIDSEKLSRLVRGGNFPLSHVYPKALRATRDVMRRRTLLMRRRAELLGHIQLVNLQYNLPPLPKKLNYKRNRSGVARRFEDPSTQLSVQTDLDMIGHLDTSIHRLELHIEQHAKVHDANTYYRLKTIPGVGLILALTLMYEIGSIDRFASTGDFLSYARLVQGGHTSAGKKYGSPGRKMGNRHLKWAFSEAVPLIRRCCPAAAQFAARVEKKSGKARANTLVAVKLGRAVYHMLRRQEVFNEKTFLK